MGIKLNMEMTSETSQNLENAGKGFAFLGMVLFVAYALLYLFSQAQPELFNLFGEARHFIIVSFASILLIIGGYALTRFGKAES